MSTTTLAGLRDYLYSTLSPANMIWLGTQLAEYGYKQEKPMKPYTIEELHERIAISERQLANGEWADFDEALDRIERELDREPEIAEAV